MLFKLRHPILYLCAIAANFSFNLQGWLEAKSQDS